MTRRAVFEEVGGFDERFVIAYNDVDLCLKIRERGYLIVWTPYAELYHFESVTRGYNISPAKRTFELAEAELFECKWRNKLPRTDPYFSPNFSLHRLDGSLRVD